QDETVLNLFTGSLIERSWSTRRSMRLPGDRFPRVIGGSKAPQSADAVPFEPALACPRGPVIAQRQGSNLLVSNSNGIDERSKRCVTLHDGSLCCFIEWFPVA